MQEFLTVAWAGEREKMLYQIEMAQEGVGGDETSPMNWSWPWLWV